MKNSSELSSHLKCFIVTRGTKNPCFHKQKLRFLTTVKEQVAPFAFPELQFRLSCLKGCRILLKCKSLSFIACQDYRRFMLPVETLSTVFLFATSSYDMGL